jgi:hypothetical protein
MKTKALTALLYCFAVLPRLAGADWDLQSALSVARTPEGFLEVLEDEHAEDHLFDHKEKMRKVCNSFRLAKNRPVEQPSEASLERATQWADFLLKTEQISECQQAGSNLLYLYSREPSLPVRETALKNYKVLAFLSAGLKSNAQPLYDLKPLRMDEIQLFRRELSQRKPPYPPERIFHLLELYREAHYLSKALIMQPDCFAALLELFIERALSQGDKELKFLKHDKIADTRNGVLDAMLYLARNSNQKTSKCVGSRLRQFVEDASPSWIACYRRQSKDDGKSLLQGVVPMDEVAWKRTRTFVPPADLETGFNDLKQKLSKLAAKLDVPKFQGDRYRFWARYLESLNEEPSPPPETVAVVMLLVLDRGFYSASLRTSETAAKTISQWSLTEETQRKVFFSDFFKTCLSATARKYFDSLLFSAFLKNFGDQFDAVEFTFRLFDRPVVAESAQKYLLSVSLDGLTDEHILKLYRQVVSTQEQVQTRLSRQPLARLAQLRARLEEMLECNGLLMAQSQTEH